MILAVETAGLAASAALITALGTALVQLFTLRQKRREADTTAEKNLAEADKTRAETDNLAVTTTLAALASQDGRFALLEQRAARLEADLDAALHRGREMAAEADLFRAKYDGLRRELDAVLEVGANLVFLMLDAGIDPERITRVLPAEYRSLVMARAQAMNVETATRSPPP